MDVEIVGRKTHALKFVTALLPSMLQQLKLDKLRGSLLITLSSEIGDSGLTNRVSERLYVVLINPKQPLKDVGLTLAHELVHVKQFARGQLRTVRNRSVWMGRVIKPSVAYLQQPWELEAYSKQELILRRALES